MRVKSWLVEGDKRHPLPRGGANDDRHNKAQFEFYRGVWDRSSRISGKLDELRVSAYGCQKSARGGDFRVRLCSAARIESR